MLKLHGFSSSNYYNVPKLAFLEKGIEFEEVVSYTGVGPKYYPEYLHKSPMGKPTAGDLQVPNRCKRYSSHPSSISGFSIKECFLGKLGTLHY